MRDGIHKTLPLPRSWKRVLEVLGNEAEPQDEIEKHLVKALLTDVKREIAPAVFGRMAISAEPAQPGLFASEDVHTVWERCVGDRAASALETRCLDHADRFAMGRHASRADIARGISSALAERLQGRIADMMRHVAAESPRDLAHLERRVGAAAPGVPVDRYSLQLLSGRLPEGANDDDAFDFDGGLALGPEAP